MTTQHKKIGRRLAQKSLLIARQQKSLFILPILSNALVLLALFLVLQPIYKIEAQAWISRNVSPLQYVIFFGLLLLFFLAAHFLTIFFNAALMVCAARLMNNEAASLGFGIKLALKNAHALLAWVLIMTTFGIVIRFLEYWMDRWPKLEIATGLFSGLSWVIATLFVTPILVIEKSNPLFAIKHSGEIIQAQWGSPLISKMGVGSITIGLRLLSLIPILIALIIGGKIIILIGSILTVVLFLTISVLHATANAMSTTALYLYATHNKQVLQFYGEEDLQNVFITRKVTNLTQ